MTQFNVILGLALVVGAALVGAPSAWAGESAVAPQSPLVAPPLRASVLGEDWERVIHELQGVRNDKLNAAQRLIKAHACLATNRSNDSVVLFRDRGDPTDQSLWAKWTEELASQTPDAAVAHYLHGDALARVGRYADALKEFDRAIQLRPAHALTLNARGVVYALLGNWNQAYDDLAAAEKADPHLADAPANHGQLNVRRSFGAPGALEAFESALKISKDFTLAKIGKASALFALGKWEESQALLHQCTGDDSSAYLASLNLAIIREAMSDAQLAMVNDPAAGVSITRDQQQKLIDLRSQMQSESQRSIDSLQNAWLHQGLGDTMRDLTSDLRNAGSVFQGLREVLTGQGIGGMQHIADPINTAGNLSGDIARSKMMESQMHEQTAAELLKQQQQIYNSVRDSGGVQTEDIRQGHLDKTSWKLLARFALQYPQPQTTPKEKP